MITTEKIAGNYINIIWHFSYMLDERTDNRWPLWVLEGIGSDGKKYIGGCEAHSKYPDTFHEKITDISELINVIKT